MFHQFDQLKIRECSYHIDMESKEILTVMVITLISCHQPIAVHCIYVNGFKGLDSMEILIKKRK